MKKLLLVVAIAAAGLFGFVAPSSAAGACATIEINVNGTASPVNGTHCTPELPALP